VSPSNTEVGLTTNGPGAEAGEPEKYYPTGRRTYARVAANDSVQAKALGRAADEAGCVTMRIWNSGTVYSVGLAKSLEQAAVAASIDVEGDDTIDPRAPNYRSLARKIGADCFVFTGEAESNGVQAVTDAGSSSTIEKIFTGDAMCFDGALRGLPAALTTRMKCTIGPLDPGAYGAPAKAFFVDYARRFAGSPDPFAIYGYESMALLLDSIDRASHGGSSDVSRSAVVDALFATKDRQSVLGTYSIDAHGDTSLTRYGLYSARGGRLAFDHAVEP
jgi:branched-chain amino acid transport system substrate-binding protein